MAPPYPVVEYWTRESGVMRDAMPTGPSRCVPARVRCSRRSRCSLVSARVGPHHHEREHDPEAVLHLAVVVAPGCELEGHRDLTAALDDLPDQRLRLLDGVQREEEGVDVRAQRRQLVARPTDRIPAGDGEQPAGERRMGDSTLRGSEQE